MGADSGSVCDSLTLKIEDSPTTEAKKDLHVFYHSAWQRAFINAEGLRGKIFSLSIIDLAGKETYNEKGKLTSSYFSKDLNCEGFTAGLYIVSLRTENEVMSKKFVKE